MEPFPVYIWYAFLPPVICQSCSFLFPSRVLTIKIVPVAIGSQEALNNIYRGGVCSFDEWRCSGDSSKEACDDYLGWISDDIKDLKFKLTDEEQNIVCRFTGQINAVGWFVMSTFRKKRYCGR